MSPILKGSLGGALGVAAALLAWHLWLDHGALHALVNLVNANAAQQQQARPAAPEAPK